MSQAPNAPIQTLRQDLRQSQQLVMTPQLQQAIKLLQLSQAELADYVLTEMESNPLLESANVESDDKFDDGEAAPIHDEGSLEGAYAADTHQGESLGHIAGGNNSFNGGEYDMRRIA